MDDRIEKIGRSIIQHGTYNDRLYLMKLHGEDMPDLLEKLDTFARKQRYGKIIARVPLQYGDAFLRYDYREEARVPAFYPGGESCLFMGCYLRKQREMLSSRVSRHIAEVLSAAREKQAPRTRNVRNAGAEALPMVIRTLRPSDVPQLAALYRKVFASYPFPVHDEDFIVHTMAHDTAYFGVFADNGIVAASSAEVDEDAGSAEMTDFATDPGFRGKNLSSRLLSAMEAELEPKGVTTGYTIARAHSFGMNITFSRAGYAFAGTLINNTNISGGIESMNVWYKPLAAGGSGVATFV